MFHSQAIASVPPASKELRARWCAAHPAGPALEAHLSGTQGALVAASVGHVLWFWLMNLLGQRCSIVGLLVVALLGAAMGAVACGGGQGGQGAPTAAQESPTPESTPFVTDGRLEHSARGYSAQIPPGWSVDADMVTFGSMKVDGFFSADVVGGVQPNISVTREDLSSGTSLEAYRDAKVATAGALRAENVDVQPAPDVSGIQAFSIDYSTSRDSTLMDKTDIVFVTQEYGWVISLTAPGGQRASYVAVLQQFLASFQLLPGDDRNAP